MTTAITREVGAGIGRCELVHRQRQLISLTVAREQHQAYRALLAELGCEVIQLPAADELPDSVFVEDVAVVVPELAIITRPGALSRRAETAAVAAVLAEHRELTHIEAPGQVDGGDVLRVGRTVWIGRSSRTNDDAIAQIERSLAPHGYSVRAIPVAGCLHLKSAATAASADSVLINPAFVSASHFAGLQVLEVSPAEPAAANVLPVGDSLIVAEAFPLTAERLVQAGFACRVIAADELAKAEGALTCCSILLTSS